MNMALSEEHKKRLERHGRSELESHSGLSDRPKRSAALKVSNYKTLADSGRLDTTMDVIKEAFSPKVSFEERESFSEGQGAKSEYPTYTGTVDQSPPGKVANPSIIKSGSSPFAAEIAEEEEIRVLQLEIDRVETEKRRLVLRKEKDRLKAQLKRTEKAPSKDVVLRTCQEAFTYQQRNKVPETVVTNIATAYGITAADAKKLLTSLGSLLKAAVFHGSSQPAHILQLFPSDFHKNLRDLLAKIIIDNMAAWRGQAVNNQVSLPRMVDFDWRVDIKTSSDSIARMSVPTCILQMQVQDNPTKIDAVPEVTSVNVELSKETLDTMFDGLSKIRDQLSSVADR